MTVLGAASSSVSMAASTAVQLPTELWGNASTWASVDERMVGQGKGMGGTCEAEGARGE